jgi:hypothetical protein
VSGEGKTEVAPSTGIAPVVNIFAFVMLYKGPCFCLLLLSASGEHKLLLS